MEILWEEEGVQFGFKRRHGWTVSKVLWEWIPNVGSKAREGAKAMSLAFVLLDFQHAGVRYRGAQNGSIHGGIFVTIKHQFFTKMVTNGMNYWRVAFLFCFLAPFLWIRPAMLLVLTAPVLWRGCFFLFPLRQTCVVKKKFCIFRKGFVILC